ncbi:MAG: aldo/keto reductase [Alphaproteobacteria bacterium]
MLHRGSDVLKPGGERIVSLLHELVREGVVEKAGVSIYSPAELDAVLQFFEPGIVQLPISLFDQRFLRSGHLARLKARGVEIHARSLFLQGLLLADPGEWPRYFAPLAQHAAIYRRWLDTHSLDALQACLGFGLAQKELDCLIIGVAGVGEFVSLLQAACCVPPVMPDSSALSLDDETFVNPSLWKLGP